MTNICQCNMIIQAFKIWNLLCKLDFMDVYKLHVCVLFGDKFGLSDKQN